MITDRLYDLIEVMAHDVAERVIGLDHVVRVTAVVHKPNAARRLGIDGVAAAVTLPANPCPRPPTWASGRTSAIGSTPATAVDMLGAERGITLTGCRACGKPPRSAARPSPIS